MNTERVPGGPNDSHCTAFCSLSVWAVDLPTRASHAMLGTMIENNSPEDPSGKIAGDSAGDAAATQTGKTTPRPERRGPPPNPIHHPLFLPVLLIAFSIWFGWDGFLTSDPEMHEHQNFNRIMFYIMVPLCIWIVPRGIREFREDKAAAANKQAAGRSD